MQALILFGFVLVFPLGLAYAQDHTTRSDSYCEKVWDKLLAEVKAGTMSAEDAAAQILALKKQKYAQAESRTDAYLWKAWYNLQAQAESRTDAYLWKAWYNLQAQTESSTDAYLWKVWHNLQAQVEAGSLTAEDAETMIIAVKKKYKDGRNAGIKEHFNKIGIGDETLGRIKRALFENGIDGGQMEPAFWGILKVMYEMRKEGEEFELDPRLHDYLQGEADLTTEQIEFVKGLARRLLHEAKIQCKLY